MDVAAVRAAFVAGAPFRHAIVDDFFDADFAMELHRAFPTFSESERVKARLLSGRVYGPPSADVPPFRRAFRYLASRAFTDAVSAIGGVAPLAMDETLDGSGVHIGLAGSTLPIHADHNTHPKAAWLYRRFNVIVYLNPRWDPSWRANLRVYDSAGSTCVAQIEPRFNRAVIMEVGDRNFHGYRALRMPAGETRQSIAAYYYATTPSAGQSVAPHPTIKARANDLPLAERLSIRVRRKIASVSAQTKLRPTWRIDGE